MHTRSRAIRSFLLAASIALSIACAASAQELPAQYFQWLERGAADANLRLGAENPLTLRALEAKPGGRHFPHAILAPAVLYTHSHASNSRRGDASMLALALRIGDLLAAEDEQGRYTDRLDSYWDTYMWLEAYRLLEPRLGDARGARWRAALLRNIALVEKDCQAWKDFPRYTGVYIGTSTNHFALWALNLYLGGKVLRKPDWQALGAHILHRLAATEQSPDGFWGEHSPAGPTNGYNLLTLAAVGVYYEHSGDAAALNAMRRATTFHANFTWPNGKAIETINDRNREWGANIYGNFAFTRFDDGRGLAALIARGDSAHELTMEWVGRVAQNTLYYHEGPVKPALQTLPAYHRQLQIPAGVRKQGPWMWCLSGITATRPELSQWFLDRQSALSVYHQQLGLLITGANSKGQPELASFRETINGRVFHLPLDGRMHMSERGDRLSLAYQRFYADVDVRAISDEELEVTFRITGRGPRPEEAFLAVQIPVEATGNSRTIDRETVENPTGGVREFHGEANGKRWSIQTSEDAIVRFPVQPYSPYRAGPDPSPSAAVATLSIPLKLKEVKRPYVRPDEQVITLRITAGK